MTRRLITIAVLAAVLLAGAALADGRRIHVGYRSHLFLVHRDGGVRRLTGGDSAEIQPRWCPHGRRILDVGDGVELRAVRDGRVLRRFSFRGYPDSLAPSPDCRRFVVVMHPRGASDRLVVVGPGDSRRELVRAGSIGRCSPYKGSECPAWSPDGRTVYFHRGGGLWSIPSDGGTPRRLARSVYGGPEVAPDGSWLAFTRFDDNPDVSGL